MIVSIIPLTYYSSLNDSSLSDEEQFPPSIKDGLDAIVRIIPLLRIRRLLTKNDSRRLLRIVSLNKDRGGRGARIRERSVICTSIVTPIHHIIIIIIIKLPTHHKFRSEQQERPGSRFSTVGWGSQLRSDFNLY